MSTGSRSPLTTANPYLPALLLLFVGSGCAALMYEIVWFQLLQLVIGSSAVSLGVLLGTFMGGMCLGSYVLPRYIDARRHPLRVYATLELGIGIMGLLLLFGMPLVNSVYAAIGGGNLFVRGIVAAICLLPPTLMMGATLPAIARWVEATPEGVSWLGFFYGGNIAGAVIGSLFAGFYLLRVYDMGIATYAAVAINLTVALLGLVIASRTPHSTPAIAARGSVVRAPGARTVYVAIALSGFTALSCEVLWTRLLSLVFGATVYAFSLILACFLFGLGIGSSIGSVIARDSRRPRAAFGWCQMLLCAAMAWAAYMLQRSLPYWPINPSITGDPWLNFQLDIVRCLWVVLPAAILWGASFPLALAAVAAPGEDSGRLVGGVYAANTVGAILGSLGTSLIITQSIHTQHGEQLLILISAVVGLTLLAPMVVGDRKETALAFDEAAEPTPRPVHGTRWASVVALIAATGVAGVLWRTVPPVPGILVAYGRYAATWIGLTNIIYVGEGLNAFVAVSETPNGVRNYHNAGKVQASSEPQDMRLQRMLGHFTHLIPKAPTNALVIGCGAGVTAGAVSIGPGVKHMTIAEIEPLVPASVSKYFGEYNYNVVDNPKVTVHIDDARHFLLTTDQKFDAITSDPLDPWVKGAATLYTREFFDIVKRHLNPGGVVTLFVQLYESNTEATKSEIGTFLEAFPHGVVWGNTNNGEGYDLVLMGTVEPLTIDIDALQAKLDRPEYAEVRQSLSEIGINSAVDLLSNYAGSAEDLAPWLKDAPINLDRNLRLQYLAGMGLNLYESGPIYADMVQYTRFPEKLFTGSPASIEAVREGIQRQLGRP
ncbi:MAG TPA: fused MFS/spermidine synthase [Vicinamibacterales bacterium]|jgi:spermidine synthase|nr:fused MFS/spermidine synthase [Vicinamibacterales bacterium]